MRPSWVILMCCLAVTITAHASSADCCVKPKAGYVPDQRTAVAIAEAVLSPVYGAKQIAGERPFHAVLRGNVWEVHGSLPRGWIGGTATVQISKDDGRILLMYHTK
jgi:hypothetical protein